jgi:hypothetical protein
VHSQAFKNCVMSCLSENKKVVFYLSKPLEPRPQTMLDFFATLPQRLHAVEALNVLPVHARVSKDEPQSPTSPRPSTTPSASAEYKEKRSSAISPDRVHCPESPQAVNLVRAPAKRNTSSPERRKV